MWAHSYSGSLSCVVVVGAVRMGRMVSECELVMLVRLLLLSSALVLGAQAVASESTTLAVLCKLLLLLLLLLALLVSMVQAMLTRPVLLLLLLLLLLSAGWVWKTRAMLMKLLLLPGLLLLLRVSASKSGLRMEVAQAVVAELTGSLELLLLLSRAMASTMLTALFKLLLLMLQVVSVRSPVMVLEPKLGESARC